MQRPEGTVPDALVGFEQNGYYEFYGEDARKVCELLGGKLLEKETALGTVPVTGFPSNQWVYRAKQLWQRGENVYLAGLNEDGTHHQTKYLRRRIICRWVPPSTWKGGLSEWIR